MAQHDFEKKLKDFLRLAHANTYAAGDENRAESSRPGSTDYRYEEPDGYRYHDVYFGNRRFLGEEVVYLAEVPIWGMNYFGSLDLKMKKSVVWGFLRKALQAGVESGEFLRGPQFWTGEVLKYRCLYEGNFMSFSGTELIHFEDKLVYTCYFHGGLIVDS